MFVNKTYTLETPEGFMVHIYSLGATITHIMAKDKNNQRANVVLGYDDLKDYESNPLFLEIGRASCRERV